MRYQPFSVPEILKAYVVHLWSLECDGGETSLAFDSFASGTSGIIVQHRHGRSAFSIPTTLSGRDSFGSAIPASFVFGPLHEPIHTAFAGPFVASGVVFRPDGASRLLRLDASQLTGRVIEFNAFSTRSAEEQLLTANDNKARLGLMISFLTERAHAASREDRIVTEGLRLIHQRIRSVKVPQLLSWLNISKRQFEKRFLRTVGVPPHRYLRVTRFQEALRVLRSDQFDRLSDVACDLGYADQSHFIKELKEMSGRTPTDLAHFIHDCVPLVTPIAGRIADSRSRDLVRSQGRRADKV